MARTSKQITASRRNGVKSNGPKTERGKAIASKNGTKHGLLAENPPLLATENLETFKELMQGLVNQYQPANPVEWHLVQQVAMAMLRQHRLWAAEAALATQAMEAEPVLNLPYPHYQNEASESREKTQYHPLNLAREIKYLQELIELIDSEEVAEIEYWQEDFKNLMEKLSSVDYNPVTKFERDHLFLFAEEREVFLQKRLKFLEKLREEGEIYWVKLEEADIKLSVILKSEYSPKFLIEEVREVASNRLVRLQHAQLENQAASGEYQEKLAEYQMVIAPAKSISEKITLLSRYEKHINSQLADALDRLESLRKNKGLLGSLRQKG